MRDLSPEKREALFPAECHFKVIAWDREGVMNRLNQTLVDLGVKDPMSAGNHSSAGTYVTYNLSLTIETHARMQEIDAALRGVDGVKMVL